MTEQLQDIAVVGGNDFCLGFRLAGVDETFEAGEEEFEETLNQVMEEEFGIVIVHKDQFNTLPQTKRVDIQNSVDPVVVPLSRQGESEDLRAKVKQALGVDIWG